jgi:hypothetical protein
LLFDCQPPLPPHLFEIFHRPRQFNPRAKVLRISVHAAKGLFWKWDERITWGRRRGYEQQQEVKKKEGG